MENVSAIIKRRKRGALIGCTIVALVMVAEAAANTTGNNFAVLTFFGLVLLLPMIVVYFVNVRNYPNPKPSYRTFNKVFYIYGSKLVLISSIFEVIFNLKRAVNPFEGGFEGGREIPSKAADLLDAGVAGGVGYQMYKQLKPAEMIEQYFAIRSRTAPRTNVQPPAPPASIPPVPAPPETPNTGTTDSSKP